MNLEKLNRTEDHITATYTSRGELPKEDCPQQKGLNYHIGNVLITTDVVLGIINTMTVYNENHTEIKAVVFIDDVPRGQIVTSPKSSSSANIGYPCTLDTEIRVEVKDSWLGLEKIEEIIVK